MHSIVCSTTHYHPVLVCKLLFTKSCTWKGIVWWEQGINSHIRAASMAAGGGPRMEWAQWGTLWGNRQSLPKQQYPALIPFFLFMTKIPGRATEVCLFVACLFELEFEYNPALWRKLDRRSIRHLVTWSSHSGSREERMLGLHLASHFHSVWAHAMVLHASIVSRSVLVNSI